MASRFRFESRGCSASGSCGALLCLRDKRGITASGTPRASSQRPAAPQAPMPTSIAYLPARNRDHPGSRLARLDGAADRST